MSIDDAVSMRDLTKTATSMMWTGFMLPVRVVLNAFLRGEDAAAAADAIYHAGDTMQRGMVDLMMAIVQGPADLRWQAPQMSRPDVTIV
jgi:hypothetical protein